MAPGLAGASLGRLFLVTDSPDESLAAGILLSVGWAAAATAISTTLYRRNKTMFFAAWFAFLTILPVSNLLFSIDTIMAERFLYLPAFCASLLITMALFALARRTKTRSWAPMAAALTIVCLFGIAAWIRNNDWQDDLAFWTAAVRTSPDSFRAHNMLAEELLKPGHKDYGAALKQDEIALAILKGLPPALDSSATYYNMARHVVNCRG
jgi:hypothetical protein